MAKFRNKTSDTLTVGSTNGVTVEPGATFDVADELVLDEGHTCDAEGHEEHSPDARVYPSTLFDRTGGTTKAAPDIAPPTDSPA